MEELTAAEVDRRTDALLEEADAYFMGEGGVHKAAAAIAKRLTEAGIDYAIAGAIALGEHGFKRLTVDVDVLIRREGLDRFKAEWLGRGYLDVRPGGKAVRDTINDVKIDFLLTGDFPGDGKPKPVAFPDPRDAAIAGDKYRVVSLPRLVEMKLASGMTANDRGFHPRRRLRRRRQGENGASNPARPYRQACKIAGGATHEPHRAHPTLLDVALAPLTEILRPFAGERQD